MSKFDASGALVFPEPWIKIGRLEFGLNAGWNGLDLEIWPKGDGPEGFFKFSIGVWFDRFWRSPTISIHRSSGHGWEIVHHHIRL